MRIRNAICAVMAAVMLFALTACEENNRAIKLTVMLNGVNVKAPLTVENLGDDFSLVDGFISYKDDLVAAPTFDEDTRESDDRKKKITLLSGLGKSLSVNGITEGSTKSEVRKANGEPAEKSTSEQNTETWTYLSDRAPEGIYYLEIQFDDNDRVCHMDIAFE